MYIFFFSLHFWLELSFHQLSSRCLCRSVFDTCSQNFLLPASVLEKIKGGGASKCQRPPTPCYGDMCAFPSC